MNSVKELGVISVCLLSLSACGGSSPSATAVDEKPLSSEPGPVHGYLSIEERSGKLVFDAWFQKGSNTVATIDTIWSSGEENCFDAEKLIVAPDFATALDLRNTLYAGQAISIQSRTGEVVELLPQAYAEGFVYATAERWLSNPLPEDAQLSLLGAQSVPAFGPISLMPLTPLVRQQPENGVTLDSAQAILWQASQDPSDRIELTVSVATGNEDKPSQSVSCRLDDDGEFLLPAELVQRLPSDTALVYTLVRTRSSSYESDGAYLTILQTSFP